MVWRVGPFVEADRLEGGEGLPKAEQVGGEEECAFSATKGVFRAQVDHAGEGGGGEHGEGWAGGEVWQSKRVQNLHVARYGDEGEDGEANEGMGGGRFIVGVETGNDHAGDGGQHHAPGEDGEAEQEIGIVKGLVELQGAAHQEGGAKHKREQATESETGGEERVDAAVGGGNVGEGAVLLAISPERIEHGEAESG